MFGTLCLVVHSVVDWPDDGLCSAVSHGFTCGRNPYLAARVDGARRSLIQLVRLSQQRAIQRIPVQRQDPALIARPSECISNYRWIGSFQTPPKRVHGPIKFRDNLDTDHVFPAKSGTDSPSVCEINYCNGISSCNCEWAVWEHKPSGQSVREFYHPKINVHEIHCNMFCIGPASWISHSHSKIVSARETPFSRFRLYAPQMDATAEYMGPF